MTRNVKFLQLSLWNSYLPCKQTCTSSFLQLCVRMFVCVLVDMAARAYSYYLNKQMANEHEKMHMNAMNDKWQR